jgi:hypothetical protein
VGSTVNRRKRTETNKKEKNRVACKYTANTTAYRFEKTQTRAIIEDETEFGRGCDTAYRCTLL